MREGTGGIRSWNASCQETGLLVLRCESSIVDWIRSNAGYAMDENNKDLISPEALQETEDAKRKIIAGEIKVTDAIGS